VLKILQGGTAVHINAGAAGLALAIVLGKRVVLAQRIDATTFNATSFNWCRFTLVRLVWFQCRISTWRKWSSSTLRCLIPKLQLQQQRSAGY